jgi:hypothetical protein
MIKTNEVQNTLVRSESQDSFSFRWGKSPDDKVKLYFDNIEDLKAKLAQVTDIIRVAQEIKGSGE